MKDGSIFGCEMMEMWVKRSCTSSVAKDVVELEELLPTGPGGLA